MENKRGSFIVFARNYRFIVTLSPNQLMDANTSQSLLFFYRISFSFTVHVLSYYPAHLFHRLLVPLFSVSSSVSATTLHICGSHFSSTPLSFLIYENPRDQLFFHFSIIIIVLYSVFFSSSLFFNTKEEKTLSKNRKHSRHEKVCASIRRSVCLGHEKQTDA